MNQAVTDERPAVSSVVTVSDNIQSTLARHRGALEYAQEAYPVLETVEVANECSTYLKNLKRAEDEVSAAKAELLDPIKAWIEKWISPTHRSIKAAIEHCDQKLLAWTKAEQERVARERREAEEADRKARAEAQARAAAEEARAREAAEARRREEAQAEAARKAAAEAGNKREAEKQAALAARLREEADAREEAGRQEAERIRQEAAARVPTEVRAAEKVGNFGQRKNWQAELAPGETERTAVLKIVAAIPERPELAAMLSLDMTAARKLARALEENFVCPGLIARNTPVGVSK